MARYNQKPEIADEETVRGMEGPGTKLITRMPIFDRTFTLIYYMRGLC